MMSNTLTRPARILFTSLSILFFITGCTNVSIYRNPLSEMSESATRTRVAIETMAQESNRAKANKLALEAALESKPFGEMEITELVPYEYIKVRSDGIKLIEQLATRLLEVIDAESGATVAKSVEDVGLKAGTLASSLGNTSVERYAGPVSSLAGTVIKIYDQNKREEILSAAVNDGIPVAQNIIEILKKDFSPGSATNINEILIEQLDMIFFEKIRRYKELLKYEKGLSEKDKKQPERIDARIAVVFEIINAHEARKTLKTLSLSETLDALSKTLNDLKKVVNSNKDPKEFAVFSRQLTVFTAYSVELLKAVDAVQEAGKK